MGENIVADRIVEDSIELCQEGIKHKCKGCTEKELCCEFKEIESLRILEGSVRWASSKRIGAQENILRQEGVEEVCR